MVSDLVYKQTRYPISMLAKEYLLKYPTLPSKTLSRLIVKENPNIATVDTIRNRIRTLRGSRGNVDRKKFKIEMPKSDNKQWESFIVPEYCKTTLILPDIHVPYHVPEAIELAINKGIEAGCDSILINGDFIDFYMLSTFSKDPRKTNIKDELTRASQLLDWFEDKLDVKIIYKTSNHEARLDRFLMKNCPEIYGMDGLNLASQLDANSRNMVIVGDKRIIKYGHLNILHGDEFGKSVFAPVNPARGLYLRTHNTSLVSHYHQTSSHTESDLNGTQITCWSTGCLCDLNPEWMPINKWVHGFSIAEKDKSGNFQLSNYKIVKGKVYHA